MFTTNRFASLTKRALLILATLSISIFAGRNSLAAIGVPNDIDAVQWFGGSDPGKMAQGLDAQLASPGWESRDGEIVRDARTLLVGQALSVRALRLLALLDEKNGARAASLKRAELATRLSRRDFGAQVLLIEEDVRRDDVASIVGRYDIILRSSGSAEGSASATLFPLLTEALAEPEIREALVPYMRRRPDWVHPMLTYALEDVENADVVADLVSRSGGLQEGRMFRQTEARILQHLVAQFKFESARKFYLSLKDSEVRNLTSPRFARDGINEFRAPITWSELEMPDSEAQFQDTNQRGDLKLRGYSSVDGRQLIARKLLLLAPGRYRLFPIGQPSLADPERDVVFELVCLSKAGNTTIWSGTQGEASLNVPIVVGQDCGGQYFDIIIDGAAGEVSVDSMSIRRETK